MLAFENVATLLGKWKQQFHHNWFPYDESSPPFRQVVTQHFRDRGGKAFGVYLIRQRDTGAILYIGKGGTVERDGHFKRQDIPSRLRNVRRENGKDIGADSWFCALLGEMGPLVVQYFIVELPIAPAYLEAALLQAYLVEHKHLPPKNSAI